MATAIAEQTVAVTERPELIEYRRQDVAIAKMLEKSVGLKIAGLDDKAGFDLVHRTRMEYRAVRVAIESRRKELKTEALEYGRVVDSEAKRLTGMIDPEESRLQADEDRFNAEKDRIRQEALAKRQAALKVRMDALAAVGMIDVHPSVVETFSELEFADKLAKATEAHQERQRIAAEEAAAKAKAEADAAAERQQQADELKAERERLDKIRQQQEAEAKALRVEQAQLQAERDKIEREAQTKRLEEERQRQLTEAREAAKLQAERDIAARAEADKAKAEALEQSRLKAEAERPYREQLEAYAKALSTVPMPNGPADKKVFAVVSVAVTKIREIAAGQL